MQRVWSFDTLSFLLANQICLVVRIVLEIIVAGDIHSVFFLQFKRVLVADAS